MLLYLVLFVFSMILAIIWLVVFRLDHKKTKKDFASFSQENELKSDLTYFEYDKAITDKTFNKAQKILGRSYLLLVVSIVTLLIITVFFWQAPNIYFLLLLIVDLLIVITSFIAWKLHLVGLHAKIKYNQEHPKEKAIFVGKPNVLIERGWVLIFSGLSGLLFGIDLVLLYIDFAN
ncbi:hypothetical protein [Furfurilactobacillus cerevisiae]|uniref:hypothetical protein n=1 Tax=Furfurilactobacillus rossiae TaxID=231049 RepID=UPI003B985905